MAECRDPRHDEPCPDCESCTACMQECCTDYWFESDGTPWGEVGLKLNESAKGELKKCKS